jgi:hypothetical protein
MSDAMHFWTTFSHLLDAGLLNEGDDWRAVGNELHLHPTKIYTAFADYWNEVAPARKLSWSAVDTVLRGHADYLGTRKIGEGVSLYRYSQPSLVLVKEGGQP